MSRTSNSVPLRIALDLPPKVFLHFCPMTHFRLRRALVALLSIAALVVTFVAPAGAQEGPTITADPASLDAPGEVEFTITGENFAPTPGFLLPCFGAEGDVLALTESDPTEICDLSALIPYAPADDGTWTATATWDVPAEGLVIAAGDAGGANSAATLIGISVPEAEAPEPTPTEVPAEEPAADDEPAPDEDPAPVEEPATLPETGNESMLLLVGGITMLAAGAMVARFRTPSDA